MDYADLSVIERLLPTSKLQAWAVEDVCAQLTWGHAPSGPIQLSWSGSSITVDHPGGPGAFDIEGLEPNSETTVKLETSTKEPTLTTFRTIAAPAGAPVARIATISDLHLGARTWGALRTMREPSNDRPAPKRCAEAAINEAIQWGADLLIIKGDAVHHGIGEHFAQLAELVDSYPELPMLLIPGNHDVDGTADDMPAVIGDRKLAYTMGVDHVDLTGVRVIVANTTIPLKGRGRIAPVQDEVIQKIESFSGPSFLAIHHQLQAHRTPRYWPMGIPGPEANEFLHRLASTNRPTLITSGHTHRNRRINRAGVTMTEVASCKDWPGVWAGYAVHEGGIRQVIRRVVGNRAINWTEYSRKALLGLWGPWAAGEIHQRCFTLDWYTNQADPAA